MRLIDADRLVDMLYENEYTTLCPLDEVSGVVDACQTVDAVQVTRCKDCQYVRDLGFDFGGKHYGSYFCVLNGPVTTSGDGFCYRGTPNERAAV